MHPTSAPPLTTAALIEHDFLEHRHKLLDIAAFLDRLDRAGSATADADFRIRALKRALQRAAAPETDRATTIQMIFSDPRTALLDQTDSKKAVGASAHLEEATS